MSEPHFGAISATTPGLFEPPVLGQDAPAVERDLERLERADHAPDPGPWRPKNETPPAPRMPTCLRDEKLRDAYFMLKLAGRHGDAESICAAYESHADEGTQAMSAMERGTLQAMSYTMSLNAIVDLWRQNPDKAQRMACLSAFENFLYETDRGVLDDETKNLIQSFVSDSAKDLDPEISGRALEIIVRREPEKYVADMLSHPDQDYRKSIADHFGQLGAYGQHDLLIKALGGAKREQQAAILGLLVEVIESEPESDSLAWSLEDIATSRKYPAEIREAARAEWRRISRLEPAAHLSVGFAAGADLGANVRTGDMTVGSHALVNVSSAWRFRHPRLAIGSNVIGAGGLVGFVSRHTERPGRDPQLRGLGHNPNSMIGIKTGATFNLPFTLFEAGPTFLYGLEDKKWSVGAEGSVQFLIPVTFLNVGAFVGTTDVTRRGDVVAGGTIGLAFGAWWLE